MFALLCGPIYLEGGVVYHVGLELIPNNQYQDSSRIVAVDRLPEHKEIPNYRCAGLYHNSGVKDEQVKGYAFPFYDKHHATTSRCLLEQQH